MELYQGEGVKEYSRRDMLKMLVGGAAGLAGLIIGGCAGTKKEPLNLTQGMEHTMTLPDGSVICDLSGEWNYGSRPWEVTFKQEGRNFVGFKTGEGWYQFPGGDKILRGTLSPEGFEKVEAWTYRSGWLPFFGKFKGNCDSFEIIGSTSRKHYNVPLNRK